MAADTKSTRRECIDVSFAACQDRQVTKGDRCRVVTADAQTGVASSIQATTQATAQSPLPYSGRISHLEHSPVNFDTADTLLDTSGPYSQPMFDV